VRVNGEPTSYVGAAWRAAASRLLDDLVSVARGHGVSLADFDRVTDLPEACLDALAPEMAPRRRQVPRQHHGRSGYRDAGARRRRSRGTGPDVAPRRAAGLGAAARCTR